MKQSLFLKPQDIALLVKLLSKKNEDWRQIDLAIEMELSQSEIAKSLSRLNKAMLVNRKKPIIASALEFLIHGMKYSFPIEIGALSFGVPTAISAPAHKRMVVQNAEDLYVWPSANGSKRGQSIKPFYPELPAAALKDKRFYDLMSAVEILRLGRARERKLAQIYLEKELKNV